MNMVFVQHNTTNLDNQNKIYYVSKHIQAYISYHELKLGYLPLNKYIQTLMLSLIILFSDRMPLVEKAGQIAKYF